MFRYCLPRSSLHWPLISPRIAKRSLVVAKPSEQPASSLTAGRHLLAVVISLSMLCPWVGCARDEQPTTPKPGVVVVPASAGEPLSPATVAAVTEIRLAESFEPLPPITVSNEDWPWWRGPERDGVSKSGEPPEQWQDGQNVLWKVPLQGRGNSSPIVLQSRVYLTTAYDTPQQEQCVVAFDVNTGEQIWQTTVHTGRFTETMNAQGTSADATLACDGERLFAAFLNDASIRVTALTLDGEIAWQTNAGPFRTTYGFGASPVLFESFVIVAVDDAAQGSISALHRKSGEVCWRIRRPAGESFASPIVARVAGRWQLLINGKKTVSSYDPATGELLWSHVSSAAVACNTMAFGDSLVFASGGMPEKETSCFLARVDETEQRRVWKISRPSSTCYVPSLLHHDQHLYNLNDDGVLTCFDHQQGRPLFIKRLAGKFTASPVIANGNLIVMNEAGTAWVFRAAPPFAVVSENQIEPGGMATPAISRGRIYLRSANHLYCVGRGS